MLKRTVATMVGVILAVFATGTMAAEPVKPGVKKWQPDTPRVQTQRGGQVMETPRPGGSVMETPQPGGEVMETPVPGSVNEMPVGSQHRIKKRIGPGPVA